MAVEALSEAGRIMGHTISEATVAVVGATGAIRKTCAETLRSAAKLILVGKREDALRQVAEKCSGARRRACQHGPLAIYPADLILTVTSAVHEVMIHPEHLKPGAVVCDGPPARREQAGARRAARRRW
ncbi:MAG: hypothetical protein IPK52_11055 [Chloroflexi bacterium]|nr:hypothetical protein [Chloroflexota bacterium]